MYAFSILKQISNIEHASNLTYVVTFARCDTSTVEHACPSGGPYLAQL